MTPLAILRHALTNLFDEDGLRVLCFDLEIDFDNLSGGTKNTKVVSLLEFLESRVRLEELLNYAEEKFPHYDWQAIRAQLGAVSRGDATAAKLQVPNRMPIDALHFKDRREDIRVVCEHLANDKVRLVSIVGRSGMGKTALACRVLSDLEQGRWPADGSETKLPIKGLLYLSAQTTGLSLGRLYTDVGRMLSKPMAARLSAHWADEGISLNEKIDLLIEAMQDGFYLILLDSLENKMDHEGKIQEDGLRLFIERCLARPSGARLLVTSQEKVLLDGALLPKARTIPLNAGLPDSDAVALLRDLDPDGDLGLKKASETELLRAVRLTRAIPRAEEILAGILYQDPAADIHQLVAKGETFEEQVLNRMVSASYQHLEEDARHVMTALAVLHRPVREDAVSFLLQPWSPNLDVRSKLAQLTNHYFVTVSRSTGEYSLHPLDRDHVYRLLSIRASGPSYDRQTLEQRAAEFYVRGRKPRNEWVSLDDLAPQLAEIEHRINAEDYDTACRVLDLIDRDYLYPWGFSAKVAELREKFNDRLTDSLLQESNLGRLGYVYHAMGRTNEALRCLEMALANARAIKDRDGEQTHLGTLGNLYRSLGDVERSVQLFGEALTIARESFNQSTEGINLGCLGVAYLETGQFQDAITALEMARDIAAKLGDQHSASDWQGHLGRAYYALGDFERAIKHYEEALSRARQSHARRYEAVRLNNLGRIWVIRGQFDQALRAYQAALEISREIGYRRGESYQLLGLAQTMLATSQFTQAYQYCEEAMNTGLTGRTGHQVPLLLAIVQLNQGNSSSARETFNVAEQHARNVLAQSKNSYEARHTLAAALVGKVICDSTWSQQAKRDSLLGEAMAEYRQTQVICNAPGVIQDALWNLNMIQRAGIEGLEPVFLILRN